MDFAQSVYAVTRKIPVGKVATYGQIARILGKPGAARAVGNALHVNPDPGGTPCYRVVNSRGELAVHFGSPGGILTQKARMEADGIVVEPAGKDGKYAVDLERYGWNGE